MSHDVAGLNIVVDAHRLPPSARTDRAHGEYVKGWLDRVDDAITVEGTLEPVGCRWSARSKTRTAGTTRPWVADEMAIGGARRGRPDRRYSIWATALEVRSRSWRRGKTIARSGVIRRKPAANFAVTRLTG